MKIETSIDTILELVDRPAFCVSDGVIRSVNRAAQHKWIPVGTQVEPLLQNGAEEYREYTGGSLHLALNILGDCYPASVTRIEQMDLFILEQPEMQAELRAFALAAQELRLPLSQIMGVSDRLFPELEERSDLKTTEQLAVINHGLYQILRIVGNMSDAFTAGISRMEIQDVSALIAEVVDRIRPRCEQIGIQLKFNPYPTTLISLVDAQKLERAVYNLLSNAIKHTVSGGTVSVTLALKKRSICLTVTDSGDGKPVSLTQRMFDHYHRDPGISVFHTGLGLGMTLIHAVATAHGGTLLLDNTRDGGLKAVLTFPLRQNTDQLCSSRLRIDYAGERDHTLVELSDILPAECYTPKEL